MTRVRPAAVALIAAAIVALPITVSPASAEPLDGPTQLSVFDPAYGSDSCGSASVAANEMSRTRLAAWTAPDPDATWEGAIEVALLDDSGAPLGEPVAVSTTLESAGPDWCEPVNVAAGADGGYLLTWPGYDEGGNDTGIFGQLISSTGALVGGNFVVSSSVAYGDIETVTAAWSPDSDRYLVTWKANVGTVFESAQNTQQLVGRFIDGAGAGVGGDFLITDFDAQINNSQAVAYGNGRWVAVGVQNSDGRAVAQVVTTAGPQGEPQPLDDQDRSGAGVSIVFNESSQQFLTAYRSSALVLGRLLDSSGVVTGAAFTIAESSGARPRLASAGEDGYLVTWHDGARIIRAQELDAAGVAVGTSVALTDGGDAYRPEIAFSDAAGKFVVVWSWYTGEPQTTNIYSRTWYVREPSVAPDSELLASIDVSELKPGQTAEVAGSGATPGGQVSVSFAGGLVIGTATADGTGDFTVSVTIPAEAPAGDNFLRVTDVTSEDFVDVSVVVVAILAATGSELGSALPAALLLVAGGALLVLAGRRTLVRD